MIPNEAVEAGVNEMLKFTLHWSPDGVRIFKDGERLEGPWGYREYDAAERALAAYQLGAALEAALPHLLTDTRYPVTEQKQEVSSSQGCGTGHSGEQLEPAVGATAALAKELPEGFTPWHGGECPCPDETVEWINAKGHRYTFRASKLGGWDWHDPRDGNYPWRIVGYRVVPAHPQKGGEG